MLFYLIFNVLTAKNAKIQTFKSIIFDKIQTFKPSVFAKIQIFKPYVFAKIQTYTKTDDDNNCFRMSLPSSLI